MATIYPAETIRTLHQKAEILPILKMIDYRFDTVQEIGEAVKCFCPIHRESVFRTLIVDRKSKRYRCSYSLCPGHKGGDLIDLYAKAKQIDPDEAVRDLVQELGISVELPPTDDFVEKTLEISGNYLTLHSYDDAESGFAKILTVQPDNVAALKGMLEIHRARNDEDKRFRTLKRLSTIHYERQQFGEAVGCAREILERFPDDIEARLRYIECLVGQHDMHKALEEYMRLADHFETQQDYERALDIYRRIERLDLDIIDVYPHIIQLMVASDQVREAVEETLERAADYERKADYDRALECYRYVLDIDESRRDVREKLVDTAIVAGLNDDLIEQCLAIVDDNIREEAFGSAARILEKLRQAAPGQAEIMHKQIEVLRSEGRDSAAAKLQLDLARQLLETGRTDEAAEQLRSIDSIESLPTDFLHQLAAAQRDSGLNILAAETYGRLAEKLIEERKVDEAADVIETVIGLNPADTGIRRRQIDLYLQAKQPEKAIEKYAGLIEQLVAQQNWDDAENAIRKALSESADDPRLLEFRAQIYKARGRIDEAHKDLLAIARKRSESEDWSSAARVLQQLLVDDPENAEAALLLGDAAMKWQKPKIAEEPLQHIASHFLGQKDYEKAESILRKLRELAPRDATVLVQLSTVYRNLEQDTQLLEVFQELVTTFLENESYAKALEYCTAILDHDAENIWALEQMIRICERTEKKASIPELCLRLADIYEKLDDSDHAQELFERAIETDPGNARARVEYMHFLVGLHRYEAASQQARAVVEQLAGERRFTEAIQLVEDLLQHTPDDIALRRALIDICRQAGMEREFITHCTQLINLYYRRNEFPEVVDLYRELLEHEPENITFRTHLIDALLRLKRRDEAIEQYFELARYYMRKESYEDAQSTLVELLDQSPGNPRALEMLVEILIETGQHDRAVQRIRELSEIYVGIGKNEKAVEVLRRVLAFDPDNREIRRRIGEISREDEQLRANVDDLLARATSELKAGNVTGAIDAQREAARLRPDDTSLRHRLSEMLSHQGSTLAALNELVQVARIRSEQGDYESSMEAVEQILNREPNHPVARRMRAELFAKMGNQQKALEEFMKITPTATPVPEDSLPRAAAGSPVPASETLQVVPDFNFDNFVVGEHNRFAHATAMAIAKAPAVHYNPLFLYSDVGLGKTHLISAIANYVATNMPELRVIYTNAEEFTGQLVEAIQHTTVNAFRSRYKAADVLLVDDIHFLAGKERAQEEFFHIFNTLFQSKRQIVVTSDRPPKDIARLEKRLKSRFGSGVIVDIQAPDVETRIAILRKELEKRDNVAIDVRLLALIAETIESNVRELKGALNQVMLRNQVSQATISEDLVREVLDMYSEES